MGKSATYGWWQRRFDGFAAALKAHPKRIYGYFAGLFVLFFLLFWSGFLIRGMGFIWGVDGLEQQYTFFILQGQWMRELLSNVFITNSFVVPQWDWNIGYGADWFLSIGNTFGNPLNWIAVFSNLDNAEWLLYLTVIATLFLGGVAFIALCRYKKADAQGTLVGALVYVFSGFSFVVYTQIYLLYSLILAPLVILGAERLFDRKPPTVLIGALGLCFLNSVSMSYCVCLLLLIYCALRLLLPKDRPSVGEFFIWVVKFLGCAVVGFMIGAISFLPQAMGILGQDRVALSRPWEWLYSAQYYFDLYEGFIASSDVGADCLYGFAPVALVALIGLFLSKRESNSRLYKVLFVVLFCFLCLPIAGKVFNGFAYPNNRWVWAFTLLISAIVVKEYPRLRQLFQEGDRGGKVIWGWCALYGAIALIAFWAISLPAFFATLAVLLGYVAACACFRKDPAAFFGTTVVACALFVFVVSMNRGVVANNVTLTRADDWIYRDTPVTLTEALDASSEAYGAQPDEDGSVIAPTYDVVAMENQRNHNLVTGKRSPSFYNSFYNSSIDEYHTSLGLVTSPVNIYYNSLQSRTPLEALMGTEYALASSDDSTLLPPLFDTLVAEGDYSEGHYGLYEASTVLPLAYLCDRTISLADYEALDPVQRQDALLQGVVLAGAPTTVEDLASGVASFDIVSVEGQTGVLAKQAAAPDELTHGTSQYDDYKRDRADIQGATITVHEPNTVLYLSGNIPAHTEAYLSVTGLDFQPLTGRDRYIDADWDALTVGQKMEELLGQAFFEPPDSCEINVAAKGMDEDIWYLDSTHHLYGGKDSYAVCLGSSSEERHTVAIGFDTPGVYSFESIGLYGEDTTTMQANMEQLAAGAASDMVCTQNAFSCSMDVPAREQDGSQVDASTPLFFRIPYAKGWSAYVDGQPVSLEKADIGFMAVELTAGEHSVELRYETPGLLAGAVLTLVGLLIYGAACGGASIYRRRRLDERR